MNKIMNAILRFICIMVLFYLIGAFVAWDLNAGNWDSLGRSMLGVMGTFIAAAISFLTVYHDDLF